MGRRGDAYDNAVAESFFASLETELLDRTSFPNGNQARSAVFDHTSRGSTTRTGCTRPSDTSHPPTTNRAPQHTLMPHAPNRKPSTKPGQLQGPVGWFGCRGVVGRVQQSRGRFRRLARQVR